MQAYKVEAVLTEDGTLLLKELPFRAGDRIEVIVLGEPRPATEGSLYALRGTPLRYDDPTESVAAEDWESA